MQAQCQFHWSHCEYTSALNRLPCRSVSAFLLSILVIVALPLICLPEIASGQTGNRWWQREVPVPSANQSINPSYLSKKRELEQTLDEMNSLARKRNDFAKAGQAKAVKSADEMLQFMGKKMNTLEHELSQIPMFITIQPQNQNIEFDNSSQQNVEIHSSSPPSANSSPNATNSYLLTTYRINNCNKNEFKTDYEYNAESLELFNELRNNISQIVESEAGVSQGSTDFVKKAIEYYEIFVKNWGDGTTIGTKEATKEIARLNEKIVQMQSDERRENTKANISIEFQGEFAEPVKVSEGWGKSTHHHFWYTVIIKCAENDRLSKSIYCTTYSDSRDRSCNLTANWLWTDNLNFEMTWGVQEVPLFCKAEDNKYWITKYSVNAILPIEKGAETKWDIIMKANGKDIEISKDEYKIISR